MKYIRHSYKKSIKDFYYFGITLFVGIGMFLFYLTYFHTPRPDRLVEYIGWILVNFAIIFCVFIAPLSIVITIERRKKWIYIGYYRRGKEGIIMITPKGVKREIKFRDIRIFCTPTLGVDKLSESKTGFFCYIHNCQNKTRYMSTYQIDMKDAFRILIWYLQHIRDRPEDFKAIIQTDLEPDDWKKERAIKRSIKKRDTTIWDEYLEKLWRTRNKEYWFRTPLEQILRNLHCPYTLEELENPSEDELVEIDESELIEEKC